MALLILASGCKREEVTHYRVAKTSPATAPMEAASGGDGAMPGMAANAGASAGDAAMPPPARPPEGGALKWKLPQGWSESAGGGAMRFATLKPATPGQVEVTVIVLPGPAGGELANVNRWRNQIGLPPLDEQGLASARRTVETKAGPVSLYDFTSDGKKRVVAGYTVVQGNTWFLKMSGDAEPVAAARTEFLDLVESLHL